MHRARRGLLIAVLLLASASISSAMTLGSSAGSFLRIGLAADRVAMGDCGAALFGGGMNWYYNPASLPFMRKRQASFGYRFLSLDRSLMYFSISSPIKPNGAVSLGFVRAGVTNIDARDSNGEPMSPLSYSDNMIHGSFAILPHPDVAIGLSIKYLIAAIPNIINDNKNLYAYGMGIDLGALVRASEQLRLGLQIRDLNAKYSWEASQVWGDQSLTKDDKFPYSIRAGAAFNPSPAITLTADAVVFPEADAARDRLQPRAGFEYRRDAGPGSTVALRAGWKGSNPSLGLGLNFAYRHMIARLDYAFVMEDVAPGGSHIIGWVFEF